MFANRLSQSGCSIQPFLIPYRCSTSETMHIALPTASVHVLTSDPPRACLAVSIVTMPFKSMAPHRRPRRRRSMCSRPAYPSFAPASILAAPPGVPTYSIGMLVNVKKCFESFKVADGKESKCTAIGDMPVLAKDSDGKICRFILKNVRFVPDFKYTLISVDQVWHEQRSGHRCR